MKNKYKTRIILGLLFFSLSLLLIVPISAFAVESNDAEKKPSNNKTVVCDSNTIDKYYSFSVKPIFSDDDESVMGFTVSSSKNNDISESDLRFKLYKIGDVTLPNPYEFTPGTSSKAYSFDIIDRDNIRSYFKKYSANDVPDDGNQYYAEFHFVSIPGENESNCTTGVEFSIKTSIGEFGPVQEAIVTNTPMPALPSISKGHEINMDGGRPSSAFDGLIYDAYHFSKGSQSYTKGTTHFSHTGANKAVWHISDDEKITLQCDFTQKFKASELKFENYYKNVKFMYGSNEFSIQGEDYVYYPVKHNDKSTGDTGSIKIAGDTCNVKCEEGVMVEYGPPVASKAGLCFQYKVRITSHVNCYAITTPSASFKSVAKLCTPIPVCVHAGGLKLNRAGPNEEFAACVKNCDGGKYSLKCSKKCYKKVYGTSSNNISNQFYSDYVNSIDNSVEDSHVNDCPDKFGCYYLSNGTINWAGRATKSAHTLNDTYTDDMYGSYYFGRYYSNNSRGTQSYVFVSPFAMNSSLPAYRNIGDGFPRRFYDSTNYCDAKCSWVGCTKPTSVVNGKKVVNYYINNPDQMEKDYKANLARYKALVASCSAAAKCSTQHAEFEMSVDYKTGETTKTISFPYDENQPNASKSTNPDKLCSNNGQESGGCTSTFTNEKSTIIYDSKAKEGEMHYYENPAGCYDSKNKSSKSTDDTNSRLYRATITFPGTWINYKTGEITFKPVSDKSHWELVDESFCIPRDAKDVNKKYWLYYQGGKICNKEVSSINSSDIESWNIKAKIKDFGLFNWNVDVKCFYALDEEDNLCKEPNDVNYRIRSVDLNDLFPDTEGSSRNGTADTGREPGFNWTSNAIVSNSKNAYYKSNPSTLINAIQGINYGVYSNKYLDYEFNLDTNTLREMRNEINDKNYTDFNEDGFQKSDKAGIGYYYSEKIRKLGGKNKTPDKRIVDLVCNNLQLDDSGNYLETCDVTNGESE